MTSVKFAGRTYEATAIAVNTPAGRSDAQHPPPVTPSKSRESGGVTTGNGPPRALLIGARRLAGAVVVAVVLIAAWSHRQQLDAALHILGRLSWGWIPVAVAAQAASLASFAMLQQRLLRAGDVYISTFDMAKISVAANAISSSLPGGAAWSAPWSWRQLRQHGADRRLATWVVLTAGVLSSIALFVIAVTGTELAGGRGPVASLRWLAQSLAVIAIAVGLLLVASRRWRDRWSQSGSRLASLYEQARVGQLRSRGWAAALILAMANWLFDLVCLAACLASVGARVDWRTVVIVYALSQLIASLPLTPGGLGVIEAGLAALLASYGTPASSAVATVLLYRALTFWGLVPLGWVVWWQLRRTLASPAVSAIEPSPGTPRRTPLGRSMLQGRLS